MQYAAAIIDGCSSNFIVNPPLSLTLATPGDFLASRAEMHTLSCARCSRSSSSSSMPGGGRTKGAIIISVPLGNRKGRFLRYTYRRNGVARGSGR